MKQLLFLAVAFICGTAAMAQQKADDVAKFNTEKYDFGKIKQGVPVSTFFEIKNISDKPLVIENAFGSCGCTTPEVPKEPIAPGATAKLKVNYNAAAQNQFTKTVTVKFAGVQEPKVLTITGEVLDEAAYNAYSKENGGSKKTTEETKTTKTKTTKTGK
jgi:Protein of unknown function (DUF1573)